MSEIMRKIFEAMALIRKQEEQLPQNQLADIKITLSREDIATPFENSLTFCGENNDTTLTLAQTNQTLIHNLTEFVKDVENTLYVSNNRDSLPPIQVVAEVSTSTYSTTFTLEKDTTRFSYPILSYPDSVFNIVLVLDNTLRINTTNAATFLSDFTSPYATRFDHQMSIANTKILPVKTLHDTFEFPETPSLPVEAKKLIIGENPDNSSLITWLPKTDCRSCIPFFVTPAPSSQESQWFPDPDASFKEFEDKFITPLENYRKNAYCSHVTLTAKYKEIFVLEHNSEAAQHLLANYHILLQQNTLKPGLTKEITLQAYIVDKTYLATFPDIQDFARAVDYNNRTIFNILHKMPEIAYFKKTTQDMLPTKETTILHFTIGGK